MMEKLDQHDPRIADMIRKAAQDTRQQEERIVAIFGKEEIPKVTEGTLAIRSCWIPGSYAAIWPKAFNST